MLYFQLSQSSVFHYFLKQLLLPLLTSVTLLQKLQGLQKAIISSHFHSAVLLKTDKYYSTNLQDSKNAAILNIMLEYAKEYNPKRATLWQCHHRRSNITYQRGKHWQQVAE
jgi:hypothetical protein